MIRIISILLLIFFSGCAAVRNPTQMKTLLRLNSSQKQMHSYVRKQERGFDRLCKDIDRKRLKAGLSKKEVISLYGDPILEREVKGKIQWLYRYPTEYFNSDRAYLYFDSSDVLMGWEFDKKEEKDEEGE